VTEGDVSDTILTRMAQREGALGSWVVESSETIAVIEPATGEKLTEVEKAGSRAVRQAAQAARAAQAAWAAMPFQDRAAVSRRAVALDRRAALRLGGARNRRHPPQGDVRTGHYHHAPA